MSDLVTIKVEKAEFDPKRDAARYAKGYADLADGSGAYVLRYEDVLRPQL